MAPRQIPRQIDPALRVPPASPALGLIGLIAGCLLVAAATWGSSLLRPLIVSSQMSSQAPLHVIDTKRALIFDADVATGDVRILNVRSGITEVARLHEDQRQRVSAISLDEESQVLTVESDNARYEYDTQTFRLLARNPVLAEGPDT